MTSYFSVAVSEQSHAGLSLHVDESGRHHATAGVDLLAGAARNVANRNDAAVAHRKIGAARGRAGAIDDIAVSNDDIVGRPAGDGCDDAQHRKAH